MDEEEEMDEHDDGLHYHDEPEEKDDFTKAIEEAFPDNDWTPDRVAAFKEAMRLCNEEYAGEGEEGPDSKSPHKGGMDLALIFGGPKGKK